MSLSIETLRRIEELALQASGETVKIDGVEYSPIQLHDVRREDPAPQVLKVHTLEALSEYLNVNRDALDFTALLIHVASPTDVWLRGKLNGHFQQRFAYVHAQAEDIFSKVVVDHARDQESMVTLLQSRCVPTDDSRDLLRIVGNVTAEGSEDYKDDGIKQSVTARTGIAVKEEIEIRNPWTLAPFRTFREVSQPESPFILRIKRGHTGPNFSLFECDGGAWKLEAVTRVGAWIEAKGFEIPVLA